MKNQKGQSILEIIITLSILGLILGGLVIVIVNSLKNSQFSKNQSLATKLAEEGLDTVRTMKSKEQCYVSYSSQSYYFVNNAQLVWTAPNSTVLAPNTAYNLNKTACTLTNPASSPETINNFFSRQIFLEKDGTSNRIKVTSVVSWNDISGLHQSKLFTILAP